MDAATDSVGRSYNKGKNLDSYIEEVKKDAGTRYAPYLPELLEDPDVKRDLEYILDTGRQNAYRDTWVLLSLFTLSFNVISSLCIPSYILYRGQ